MVDTISKTDGGGGGGREGGGGGETADVDSISCFRVEDRGEERSSSGVEWNRVEWREPKGQVDTDR